jgi:hypothetical protein
MTLTKTLSESNLSQCSTDTNLTEDVPSAVELSSNLSSGQRRVGFGDVEVREYERVVGDHPDVRLGVPISIGWGYYQRENVPLEKYESERKPKALLRMSSVTRKKILHEVFGIPEEEIRQADKEVQKIKKSREHTKQQSDLSAKTESAARGLRRKFKKAFSVKKLYIGFNAAAANQMMMPMAVH